MEFGPGATFAGYAIQRVIKRGGMGVIYEARESQPDRLVALKVIAPALASDAAFRTRFLREAQTAATIEHPNVVPVLRVGEEDGVLFLTMRLIRGVDLAALISAEGRLAPGRAARIIDQVAEALEAAHTRGLVHRDVKPANILIETGARREHVYLTDFGLSKSFDMTGGGLTSTGVIVGTTNYMPPEQWTGGQLDARVDVYSLGCVLFETLTGRVPFARESQAARMYAHLTDPPPRVSETVPDAAAFDPIVTRALAKAPEDRFPSTADLGRAALAAAGEPAPPGAPRSPSATTVASPPVVSPPAVSPTAPTARVTSPTPATLATELAVSPARRRPRVLVGGVLAALAAAVVIVLVIAGGGSSPHHARTIAGSKTPPPTVAPPKGTVDVFWQGTDLHLWEAVMTNGSWVQSMPLLRLGKLGSPPAVAVRADGEIDVFWKGNGHGNLWEGSTANGWRNATAVPDSGTLGSGPAVAVGRDGTEYVFWHGGNGRLWETTTTAGGWSKPVEHTHVGVLGSAPAAVALPDGQIDVFWKANLSGDLWEGGTANSWAKAALVPQGVTLNSGPAAVADARGDVDVFWQATNGYLTETTLTGTHFSQPAVKTGAGRLAFAPAPAVLADGEVDVFWKGQPPGYLWVARSTNGWATAKTDSSSGPLGSGPAAVAGRR